MDRSTGHSSTLGAAAARGGPEGKLADDPLTPPPERRGGARRAPQGRGDVRFRRLAAAGGVIVVVAVALIGAFLLIKAIPSVAADHANFFTSTEFKTDDATQLRFGVRDLLVVTVLSSALALLLAVPVAIGIAVYLTHYAPRRLSSTFSGIVDLLAAVPSIVFGLWGIFILAPALGPVETFLNDKLSWIPLFADGNVSISGGGTIFTAGTVLAVMILPIITAVTREVYRQTPSTHIEAAQALGATRWEVVRMTVLPFGRSGATAAAMLGLGRALGETVAVLIILRSSAQPSKFSLFDGGYTFASKIASAAAEFSAPLPTGAYVAAGFVLFVLTFFVNASARAIAGRRPA